MTPTRSCGARPSLGIAPARRRHREPSSAYVRRLSWHTTAGDSLAVRRARLSGWANVYIGSPPRETEVSSLHPFRLAEVPERSMLATLPAVLPGEMAKGPEAWGL